MLARLISILKEAADSGAADTGMIYVSDHGESLGENNMYLHGMPYAIAPEAQIHVPMVVWLSKPFAASRAIDAACLATSAAAPVSHDNLFHSVLGLFDIRTVSYSDGLDLFRGCRHSTAEQGSPATPTRVQ